MQPTLQENHQHLYAQILFQSAKSFRDGAQFLKEVIDIHISVLHRVAKVYLCQCFLDIVNYTPYFRLHPHSFFCNSNIFVYMIYFVEGSDSKTEFKTRYDTE